jgi:predicted TIM-barrel fold metal-dependent hydrolase
VLRAAFHLTNPPDRPTLAVPAHHPQRPKFPAIDAHAHLRGPFAFGWEERSASDLEAFLDRAGMDRIVDLNGQTGEALDAELARFRSLGDRVAVFAGIDYKAIGVSDRFGEVFAAEVRRARDLGAKGIKVWKTIGLHARDRNGALVGLSDERLDALWQAAGDVELPILIHVADPRAFFEPLNRSNERWEELRLHPEWHYWPPRPRGRSDHPGYPAYDELIDQFRTVLRRHPTTRFIGAHLASTAEDLALLESMLVEHPNLDVDISARVAELGRQPYTAHDLLTRHVDRFLFGADHADIGTYRIYYRLLETRDEYFRYGIGRLPQNGRWRVYGLGLADETLERIYRLNALRVIWGEGGRAGDVAGIEESASAVFETSVDAALG